MILHVNGFKTLNFYNSLFVVAINLQRILQKRTFLIKFSADVNTNKAKKVT